MSTPPPLPAQPPGKATFSAKACLKWAALILIPAVAVGIWLYVRFEAENARFLESLQERARQTTYQARLLPVSVDFQRGPTQEYKYLDSPPWRGLPVEVASCADDSEGRDYAEFYQMTDAASLLAQPFADADHPELRKKLERLYESDVKSLWANAIVIKEEQLGGGWRLRTTLVPTPYGAAVQPTGLPADVAAKLALAEAPKAPTQGKAEVDPRSGGGGLSGQRYTTRKDPMAEAEKRVEREYKESRGRFDDRHHHFYLAEAVCDYGQGRLVILRRMGQVFGDESIVRAAATIQKMTESATPPAL